MTERRQIIPTVEEARVPIIHRLTTELALQLRPHLEVFPDDTSLNLLRGINDYDLAGLNRALVRPNPPERYVRIMMERLECPIDWEDTVDALHPRTKGALRLVLWSSYNKGYETMGVIRHSTVEELTLGDFQWSHLYPHTASFLKHAFGKYIDPSVPSQNPS